MSAPDPSSTLAAPSAWPLACPDTRRPLRAVPEGFAREGDPAEAPPAYRIEQGIAYLLPKHLENATTKEQEREGWRKVFEANQWVASAEGILTLADRGEGEYWQHVRDAMPYARAALAPLAGKIGLDLACGLGWATADFAKAGARVIAADFNDTVYNGLGAAVQMRPIAPKLDFIAVCCDGESLPILDGTLDFTFICSALHHMTRPDRVLAEIHRCLKPGGVLIDICEAFRTGFNDEAREEKHEVLVQFREAGINELSYTQAEYSRLFKGAGFQLETFIPHLDAAAPRLQAARYGAASAAIARQRNAGRRALVRAALMPGVRRAFRWAKLNLRPTPRVFVARKP